MPFTVHRMGTGTSPGALSLCPGQGQGLAFADFPPSLGHSRHLEIWVYRVPHSLGPLRGAGGRGVGVVGRGGEGSRKNEVDGTPDSMGGALMASGPGSRAADGL